MLWADLAWPDLQDLDTTTDGRHHVGLVPVGAIEQHGPHLPTGTDTILATAICDAAAARCGAFVLPAIPVGCSYGHGTVLPGTLSLSPELLAQVVRQYAEWAAVSGLRRLLFLNAISAIPRPWVRPPITCASSAPTCGWASWTGSPSTLS
jgi:creatinine amidohydrolase